MREKNTFKILIVDDELLIRRSLRLAGENRGHIIKEAENGLQALSILSSFNPDLAFIDILMPKINGWELLKKIPKASQTKIIIISAHDEIKEKDIYKTRADLFIKKPFNDIFKTIEQAEELINKSQL